MISFGYTPLGAGVLLSVGILVSKASGRLGVPPPPLFLLVGVS